VYSLASSEFLTNKEQGDWAEQVVLNAINDNSLVYLASRYGRSESLAAGDPGFEEFYAAYQDELNRIGKRPDLLIFERTSVRDGYVDIADEDTIRSAVAAIEVRSSSFLANRYAEFVDTRTRDAVLRCRELQGEVLKPQFAKLLAEKAPEIHRMIRDATDATFRELDFRRPSWASSAELKKLSDRLRELKEQIQVLHKRDHLSITPKLEDLALVNRWIQHYDVPHYYLQVFFDKAYVIPFRQILEIVSDPAKEDDVFSVEQDVKNQGKTTLKINVRIGKEVLGRIDMPNHKSAVKELERGRLLFYVTFHGGRGYLDHDVFMSEIINNA